MFEKLKRNQVNEISAPVTGKCVSLNEVPDPVFSSRMMGEGVAFLYQGDMVYSPCDGEVIMIADTKHAIGLKTANGTEILLHIGMDTVNLQGKGFQVLIKPYAKVKTGDALLRIDRGYMSAKGIDLITPLIVTNTGDYMVNAQSDSNVNKGSVVISTKRR